MFHDLSVRNMRLSSGGLQSCQTYFTVALKMMAEHSADPELPPSSSLGQGSCISFPWVRKEALQLGYSIVQQLYTEWDASPDTGFRIQWSWAIPVPTPSLPHSVPAMPSPFLLFQPNTLLLKPFPTFPAVSYWQKLPLSPISSWPLSSRIYAQLWCWPSMCSCWVSSGDGPIIRALWHFCNNACWC